jgi:hypothetical protein
MPPPPRPPIDPDRQLLRRWEGRLQTESMWLQKLLFALGKVEEAREKLAATQQEPLRPLVVMDDGTPVPMGLVALNVRQRVDEVMKALGQGAHNRLPS